MDEIFSHVPLVVVVQGDARTRAAATHPQSSGGAPNIHHRIVAIWGHDFSGEAWHSCSSPPRRGGRPQTPSLRRIS